MGRQRVIRLADRVACRRRGLLKIAGTAPFHDKNGLSRRSKAERLLDRRLKPC
jgi:hypothetical protein